MILKKIELRRVNLLKRLYSRRGTSFFYLSSRSRNFATIHSINEAFVQDGNIRINKKTMVNFNENQRKKRFSRAITKQLNLKKSFFSRIDKSPEEIKRYFRAKLRNNGKYLKKKLEMALKRIGICMKRICISS